MRVLFVCAGNTCRSPMAATIARRLIASHGLDQLEVDSAGIHASEDEPAAPEAVELAAEQGLSLAEHASKRLTLGLLAAADRIVVMDSWHEAEVRRLKPDAKVVCLELADPFNRGRAAYVATWAELEALVPHVLRSAGEPRMGRADEDLAR